MHVRDKAKRLQAFVLRVMGHPMVKRFASAEDQALAGDLVVTLGEWGDILENMKGVPDEQQSETWRL